jgi:hypothetical protein
MVQINQKFFVALIVLSFFCLAVSIVAFFLTSIFDLLAVEGSVDLHVLCKCSAAAFQILILFLFFYDKRQKA